MAKKPLQPVTAVALEEIRRRRDLLKMTHAEAGIAAGQPAARARQWWNDFEKGRYPDPQISKLVAAARALKCTVNDLLA